MKMAAAPMAAGLTLLLSLGLSGVGGAAQNGGQVQQGCNDAVSFRDILMLFFLLQLKLET